ncbi:MAG: hypothetical protein ACK4NH_02955, partial [Gemmobacter sp.]
MAFETDVFINCPFDDEFAPLLQAMLFCIVYAGLNPRLATERLEAGQNRLDKIYDLARGSRYSIHDLSRCQANVVGEYARMNMPFELGLDLGIRRAADDLPGDKRFLIFERNAYETKRALSDLAGQDVEAHGGSYEKVIIKLRNFLKVEAGCDLPGAARIKADYETFQGFMRKRNCTMAIPNRRLSNFPRPSGWTRCDCGWRGGARLPTFFPEPHTSSSST